MKATRQIVLYLDVGITPSTCASCPLAERHTPTVSECGLLSHEEVAKRNDDPELHLHHKPLVWNRKPVCREADWQQKAKEELSCSC